MILIEKISIFCVLSFIFIFDAKPALVESADIDEISAMLRKENIDLSNLKKEIKKKVKIQKIEIFLIKIILGYACQEID